MQSATTHFLRSVLAAVIGLFQPHGVIHAEGVADDLPAIPLFFAESARFAAALSLDGNKIACLAPNDSGMVGLWVADCDTPDDLARVSNEDEEAVTAFFWIGDHRLLWQARTVGAEARFFLHDLGSGVTRRLMEREHRHVRLEGVVDSCHASILVGISDKPEAYPGLYSVDLDGDDTPEWVASNDHQILTWALDRAGVPLCGLRWTASGAKELLSFRESPARVVFRTGPADDLRLLKATPDGKRAWVITNVGGDLTRIEWIDLTDGSRSPIAQDPQGRVDVEGMLIADGTLLASGYSGASLLWHAEDTRMVAPLAAIGQAQPEGESLNLLGIDKSLQRVLFSRFSGRDPGAVYLYDADSGKIRMLWREHPDIDPTRMCESRPIEYPARDGTRIPAYLTIPKNAPGPLPLVVFPHGGPRMRTHGGFDGRAQFLASRGYLVLQPNFRGSRGYGKAFMDAGDGQWGRGLLQTDVTDGVKHLIRAGLADSQRVAIFGGSYGGYSVLAGLAFTPDLYAAGISLFGVSDLLSYATHHPPEWEAFAGDTMRRLGNPDTASGRKTLEDLSPVNHARAIKAPLLIYHGMRDHLVPVDHAHRMAQNLADAGNPPELLLGPDEAHGFAEPESEMAVYRAIEIFLHQHLGGHLGPEPSEVIKIRLEKLRETAKSD